MALAVVLLALVGGLLVMSRKRYRFRIGAKSSPPQPDQLGRDASPVTRQHRHLLQGGLLSEASLESKKENLRRLLERGDLAGAESELSPGLDFVVQVRALAEIGSDAAVRLLERQFDRPLSSDPEERGWYWFDLARGLRSLQRVESLAMLLRRADSAFRLPHGTLFAGELVAFPGFEDCLLADDPSLHQPARGALWRALVGIREGQLPLTLIAEAQLGELLARLATHPPAVRDSASLLTFLESLRLLRRSEHAERFVQGELTQLDLLDWQYACVAEVEGVFRDRLDDAARELPGWLEQDEINGVGDLLTLADELRVDLGSSALRWEAADDPEIRIMAVRCHRWAKGPQVVPWLCSLLRRGDRSGTPMSLELRLAAIEALRAHPCDVSESELIRQTRSDDPAVVGAAVRALGWWQPVRPREVRRALERVGERGLAEAALARLGDPAALVRVRARLTDEDPVQVRRAIRFIAEEGVSWLWPELDRFVDSENLDIAFEACESLERMREDVFGPLS